MRLINADNLDCKTLPKKLYPHMQAILDFIDSQPTVNVVERSEYIELLKENERLRGDLEFKSEALNSIGQIHKEYVSKIDKAIEEITKLKNSTNRMITEEPTLVNECYKRYVNCFDECLKIIKQNKGR